jgi:hypothetical protein
MVVPNSVLIKRCLIFNVRTELRSFHPVTVRLPGSEKKISGRQKVFPTVK